MVRRTKRTGSTQWMFPIFLRLVIGRALMDLEYDIRLMLGCLNPASLQLSLVGSG